jgi:hypothetical protein
MGNGSQENAMEIADIVGTICDKQGNELVIGKMTDVTVLPTAKFNLFSVTQMLKKGWELRGNDQAMSIVNGDKEVRFDIQIPTPKGMLFAMYVKRCDENWRSREHHAERQKCQRQYQDNTTPH